MATLAKKINIKRGSTTQTAEMYSTAAEAGARYIRAKVDNVNAYIPLVDVNSSDATYGRVKNAEGTFAIGKTAVPPYGYEVLTTSGSWTVPSNVSKVRVTCIGGGAGAFLYQNFGDFADCGYEYHSTILSSGNGGDTIFKSVIAKGATGSKITTGEDYEVIDNGITNVTECYPTLKDLVDSKGFINGSSNSLKFGGTLGYDWETGPATPLVDYKDEPVLDKNGAAITAGAGGDVESSNDLVCTGGSGNRVAAVISVTPSSTIAYTIGDGGKAWHHGTLTATCITGKGDGACPGSPGIILVEWGKGAV